jgi:PEP-CTERM motif
VDDLNIVLVPWNQNVTPGDLAAGDPTGDGFVGVDDLNVVLVNWNNGTPPAAGAAIPEPASLALIGLGGMAMLRRRR